MSISTHVLDIGKGVPAVGVAVTLLLRGPGGSWMEAAQEVTDSDGRVREFDAASEPGEYRLEFATAAYFASLGVESLYPSVVVDFEVRDPDAHYHVPLLLAPFGYTTYRGS